jgi:nitrate reductase assembly molybdenum cofactor insertion protein NarJ
MNLYKLLIVPGMILTVLYAGSKLFPTKSTEETQTITYQELTQLQQDAYQEGANEALTAFAMVALQSELEKTNRTYAAMFDMVREKLSIMTIPKN